MRLPVALSLLALTLLSSCAPTLRGDTRLKALAPALTGTYNGTGQAGLLKNAYRMLLNIDPRTGRADAVLTNTSLNKVYPASGTFTLFGEQGGMLNLQLFEGKREAGTLQLRLTRGDTTNAEPTVQAEGKLNTLLFNFQMNLQKVNNPMPLPRFLPDVPPSQSQYPGQVSPANMESQPVYVTPTPRN